MEDNGICRLLGLAKRAGKLAAGDEPVREFARAGVVRVVFLTSDAGAAISRQAAFVASRADVPLLTLPVTTEQLGGALGRRTCALCALSDSGFAAKAAERLASGDPAFQPAAAQLAASHARFQSRRGTKKHRTAQPAANASRGPSEAGSAGQTPARRKTGIPGRPPVAVQAGKSASRRPSRQNRPAARSAASQPRPSRHRSRVRRGADK